MSKPKNKLKESKKKEESTEVEITPKPTEPTTIQQNTTESTNPPPQKKGFSFLFPKKNKEEKTLKQLEESISKFDKPAEKKKKREAHDKALKARPYAKKHRAKLTTQDRKRHLKIFMEKAGLDINPSDASKKILLISIGLTLILCAYAIFKLYQLDYNTESIIVASSIITSFGLILVLLLVWGCFYFYLDLKMYQRTQEVEKVLPDYLQIVASNIRAGMPIDRALWFAVRPRFGVLAKEIEIVAKETLSGEDLGASLNKFANKYDSVILKRSINLLIEGMNAGGEVGGLLNKIAIDIQETRIMRKEMAANVSTYAIFITFAAIAAAPFLFALSFTLVTVVQDIGGSIDMGEAASSGSGIMSMSISGNSIVLSEFKIFCVLTLMVIAFFSAVIVAIIQKGTVRQGLRLIPTYIIVSQIIFFIAVKGLGLMLGDIV